MLDVIITSTCRKTIERTLNSFLENVYCSDKLRFLVNIDVKNPKYLPRLTNFLHNMGINEFRVNHNPKPQLIGQTEAINYLYPKVLSPYYFNLEDDWIFRKKINLDSLIALMNDHENIHHIRFNKERTKDYAWLYHLSDKDSSQYRLPNKDTVINDFNLAQTHVWSFNPSLVRTSILKKMLPVPTDANSEKYLCHKYDEIFRSSGAYILGKIGDSPIVSDIGRNKIIVYLKRLKRKTLRLAYGQ